LPKKEFFDWNKMTIPIVSKRLPNPSGEVSNFAPLPLKQSISISANVLEIQYN
jgi:hypothetical protein